MSCNAGGRIEGWRLSKGGTAQQHGRGQRASIKDGDCGGIDINYRMHDGNAAERAQP
jgi:hypothetical protein